MPPREKEFDAVCLVIDIGVTSAASGFLNSALRCASELVQRKLFSESPDRFGLVQFGTERAANPLEYPHVALMERGLAVADWQLLEFIEKHIEGSDFEGDWLDAVVVALNFLKEETEGTRCRNKKIVLLSDLGCAANKDKLEVIAKGMQLEKVEFTFIGPEWGDDGDENGDGHGDGDKDKNGAAENLLGGDKKPKSAAQLEGEAMVGELVAATEGLMCTMEDAMGSLMFRERKAKKPFPWKVSLEVGPDIRINAVGYILIRREPPKTWKRCLAKPGASSGAELDELKADVTYVRNNEDQEVIESNEELIMSYKYGSDLVTVSDEDVANFTYQSGPKSMTVLGFMPRSEIRRQLLIGDGAMTFQPVEDDDNSATALSALAFALQDLEMAAVVRRVYRNGSCPRLGVLVPEYSPDEEEGVDRLSLIYVELPYMEDVREYQFAPVHSDKVRPSEDQLSAVDGLIDSMMLTGGGDGQGDLLATETILNPGYQYLYSCLTHRATRPGQLLPDLPPHIRSLMAPPEEVTRGLGAAMRRMMEEFPLEAVVAGKGSKRGAEEEEKNKGEPEKKKDKTSNFDQAAGTSGESLSVTEVGSSNPVRDFEHLLKNGESLVATAQQLEQVVEDLIRVSYGTQMYSKIAACLGAYRSACLTKGNPDLYNDFLREFKHILNGAKKQSLMLEVAEKDLGLISRDEHYASHVGPDEAKQYLA